MRKIVALFKNYIADPARLILARIVSRLCLCRSRYQRLREKHDTLLAESIDLVASNRELKHKITTFENRIQFLEEENQALSVLPVARQKILTELNIVIAHANECRKKIKIYYPSPTVPEINDKGQCKLSTISKSEEE